MKKKYLELEEYRKNIKPEERISFSRKSPFNQITTPPQTIFVAWHGPEVLVVHCSTGTMYVCRKDQDDPKPLNFDVFSICTTKDPKYIEIKSLSKQKYEYHWTEDLPQFIKGPAPKWVKEEMKKIPRSKKNNINSIFQKIKKTKPPKHKYKKFERSKTKSRKIN